jgi:CheY-like chemotaxis protein
VKAGPAVRYLLLVEDDAGMREMLRAVIEHAGYRVVAVEDGREALLYLQGKPPPFLILRDLQKPVDLDQLIELLQSYDA